MDIIGSAARQAESNHSKLDFANTAKEQHALAGDHLLLDGVE